MEDFTMKNFESIYLDSYSQASGYSRPETQLNFFDDLDYNYYERFNRNENNTNFISPFEDEIEPNDRKNYFKDAEEITNQLCINIKYSFNCLLGCFLKYRDTLKKYYKEYERFSF